MTPSSSSLPPEPGHPSVSRRRWRVPLIWLVPAVAALIGLSMLIHTWLSAGPQVEVSFLSAAGLEAGKTPVKYKDVTVGTVSSIALSDDGSHVVATLSLVKSSFSLTRQGTRFWVVRPRVGAGGVSGVDTLLSGPYIALDIGTGEAPSHSFTGLETPPTVTGGMSGKSFTLRTDDLGSLDIGSPVYYRRIQVGRVASYQLGADGKSVELQIFIDAPNDRFVTRDTRFWNASGVDVTLGADGLKLKTQSLATIVSGGIAFATPPYSQAALAPENTAFSLAPDQTVAMAAPDGPAQYVQLRFEQPLRGLSIGAPVQFSGVDMGKVVSLELDYDPARLRFPTVVGVIVYPQRLGRVLDKLPPLEGDQEQQTTRFLKSMVEHGLRAQARTGNLLTGQLYIALDFMPNASPVAFDTSARPVTLPTIGGSFDKLQEQLASIVGKLDKLPLESMGQNLDAALADLDKTLKQVNAQVLPQTTQTLQQTQHTLLQADQTLDRLQAALAEDAPLPQNLQQTLQEAQRAARSLRTLTDLLGRHPESLLRGRPDQAPPPPTAAPGPTPDSTSSSGPQGTAP